VFKWTFLEIRVFKSNYQSIDNYHEQNEQYTITFM